jgi:hypothetical protein
MKITLLLDMHGSEQIYNVSDLSDGLVTCHLLAGFTSIDNNILIVLAEQFTDI